MTKPLRDMYPPELKTQVLSFAEKQGHGGIKKASAKYGIPKGTIVSWRHYSKISVKIKNKRLREDAIVLRRLTSLALEIESTESNLEKLKKRYQKFKRLI